MANYLGRNVNLALLVIIIGVIVALVGTTVFFQRSLQNRTQEFESTTGTLSDCQTSLSNFKNSYSQSLQEVNKTSQDIRKYDQLYEQRTVELKDTQDKLDSTSKQLTFQTLLYNNCQQNYDAVSLQNGQLNNTIVNLNSRVNSLQDRVNNICNQCRMNSIVCSGC